eukprot:2478591-Ditylum_brightwellii.AAC.1
MELLSWEHQKGTVSIYRVFGWNQLLLGVLLLVKKNQAALDQFDQTVDLVYNFYTHGFHLVTSYG